MTITDGNELTALCEAWRVSHLNRIDTQYVWCSTRYLLISGKFMWILKIIRGRKQVKGLNSEESSPLLWPLVGEVLNWLPNCNQLKVQPMVQFSDFLSPFHSQVLFCFFGRYGVNKCKEEHFIIIEEILWFPCWQSETLFSNFFNWSGVTM